MNPVLVHRGVAGCAPMGIQRFGHPWSPRHVETLPTAVPRQLPQVAEPSWTQPGADPKVPVLPWTNHPPSPAGSVRMTEKMIRDGDRTPTSALRAPRVDPASLAPRLPSPTCSLHFPDRGLGFLKCVKVFHTLRSLQSNAPSS